MRHVLVLVLTSIFFAFMTAVAWQHDTARARQESSEKKQAMDARLQALETDYLKAARSLLALVPPARSPAPLTNEDLQAEIDTVLASFESVRGIEAREAAFDTMVVHIHDVLLRVEPERFGNSIAQEWRRQNDRMNGALHRRSLLLDQIRDNK